MPTLRAVGAEPHARPPGAPRAGCAAGGVQHVGRGPGEPVCDSGQQPGALAGRPDVPGLRLTHARVRASRPRQATVYDNQHFGSFVAVVEQFVNCATEHTAGGVRPAALYALTHSLTRAPAAPTGPERLLLAEQRWVGSADARERVPGSGRQGRRHLPHLPRRRTCHSPPQGAHAGAYAGAGHRSLARYAPSIGRHQLTLCTAATAGPGLHRRQARRPVARWTLSTR